MRDIIQKVMASEEEAGRIVEAARAEAERIVAESRTAAQNEGDAARRAMRAEADRIVADAVAAAEARAGAETEAARKKIAGEIKIGAAAHAAAVDMIVCVVTGAGGR